MSALVAVGLALVAAATQLAVDSVTGASTTLPLFVVGVLAAWAIARDPAESALAAIPSAILLGTASEQPVGWFLLALTPTPLAAAAARALGTLRLPVGAALTGAIGAAAYIAMLALGGPPPHPATVLATSTWTGLVALAGAIALVPFRPRVRGMFW